METKYRLLKPSEIDVRIGTVGAKGVTLLLYKDARVDMNILDETHGSDYWQRDHKEIKGNMYAGVGIWNHTIGQWVWKWDCGTESYTEKEKGEASDSFKRACVNVGIGRELYTSPFIFIPCETEKKDRGYELKDKWLFSDCRVSQISYTENREIKELEIVDKKGNVMFGNKKPTTNTPNKPNFSAMATSQIDKIQAKALTELMEKHGVDKDKVCAEYKVVGIEAMTNEQWSDAQAKIRKKYEK